MDLNIRHHPIIESLADAQKFRLNNDLENKGNS